jgi:hypothetical protein
MSDELAAQTNSEYLMLVTEMADDFRARFGALQSLGEGGQMRALIVEKIEQTHARN